MIRTLFFLSFVSLAAFSMPALAQKAAPQTDSVVAQKKKATPVDIWIAAENALIDPLDKKGKETIFIIRNKYSVIRAIDVVERDVGSAIEACAKANPAMKPKLETRFKDWKNAVNPIIDTAKKNMDGEIEGQTIVDPDDFKNVLKLNDDAFTYSDKQTVKNPVSSPEACEGLLASMDRTESEMISLLQKTLLPPSVIKSRAEKQKADNEKSSKKPPADKTE